MANNEAMQVQDVEQAVRRHGFAAVRTRTDDLLVLSIEKAFEMFGEDCSKALLFQLCTMHRMSHEELLSRYDLIEKSLRTVFGFGSEAITAYVRANFVKNLGISDSGQSLAYLLRQAKEKEVVQFLSRLPAREHVALIYSDDRLAQKLGSVFLESGEGPRGALTNNRDKTANVMLYDNLYGFDDDAASKRMLNWIQSVKATGEQGAPATIASEAGLFLGNGLAEAYMMFDRAVGARPDGVRMLCCCGLDKLASREHLVHLCETHSHVILDDSLVIYRRKQE